MTVVSLQKQPGTVEHDGSRRASPPILAAASLPTGHSGCRAVACDRHERLRPVLAARRGQPRSRRGGHVPRRAGWVLQLRGEISLQIRCRCSEAQSPLQFTIAQPDGCGSSRTGCPVHRVRLEVWSDEVGRESLIGWIGAVRPSRRPRARPPQDEELSSCHPKAYPRPEERRRARLEGRKTVMQPFVSISCPASIRYPSSASPSLTR
jgi:hypothetical protein